MATVVLYDPDDWVDIDPPLPDGPDLEGFI
jgi:hypothetical protein